MDKCIIYTKHCIIECSVQGWKAVENFGKPPSVVQRRETSQINIARVSTPDNYKDCQRTCMAPECRSFSFHLTFDDGGENATFHCNHYRQLINITTSERNPYGRVGIASSTQYLCFYLIDV